MYYEKVELLVEEFEMLSSVVLQPLRRMTDGEFLALCERHPDCRMESTTDGEVIIMPPANPQTGARNQEIGGQLWWWGRERAGRSFDSSSGFFLRNGARRSPDAAWASGDRLAGLASEPQFWHISPNFVIELKSTSDRLGTLRSKMREWVDNGVDLAWLIVPETRTVEIYRVGEAESTVLEGPQEVRGEGAVEGFVLQLERVWAVLS
jgi:Uma2 family endonuclease